MAAIESFTDTQTAFSYKSDESLRKSLLIFSVINYKLIVKLGTYAAKTALFFNLPIKKIVKRTIFQQFCGGETIEESRKTLLELSKYNVKAILDYAVEGEKSEKGFDQAAEEIKRTIKEASTRNSIPFSVFKPTGVAPLELLEKVSKNAALTEVEEKSWKNAQDRIYDLCKTAYDLDVPIMIDSEESWIQPAIDQIVYAMMKEFNQEKAIVYNTFQMYRKEMLAMLRKAFHYAATYNYYLGAKLVRGAYMEKERDRAEELGYEDPICATKEATDDSYNEGLKFCLNNIQRVYLVSGSHNEYSNYYLTLLLEKYNIKPSDQRVYFAQLYGMSDNVSFKLAKEGFNSVKYLPYGPVEAVLPYLIRRAEENTSIAGQSSREFQLVKAELNRRKIARKINSKN